MNGEDTAGGRGKWLPLINTSCLGVSLCSMTAQCFGPRLEASRAQGLQRLGMSSKQRLACCFGPENQRPNPYHWNPTLIPQNRAVHHLSSTNLVPQQLGSNRQATASKASVSQGPFPKVHVLTACLRSKSLLDFSDLSLVPLELILLISNPVILQGMSQNYSKYLNFF